MKCYLLVGGLSSRMGVPKASVTLGGRTFEERVVAAARVAFDEVIAIDRPGGAERAGIRTIFEEPHEGRGAIFGLARALADAGTAPFWLLGVDYPLITATLLSDLRARFEESKTSLLVPVWDGNPQMLCAGYSAAVAPRLAASIASGDLRLRALLDEPGTLTVPESVVRAHHAGEPLMNVNDPADLERARSIDERAQSPRS